jgi:two-component system, NarL family, response regulator NreC
MAIRVVLADDHELVRYGLTKALEGETDIKVVGEAENGRRITELADKLKPDVVIMDIEMPDLNGIDATRQVTAANPRTRVIGLSMHSSRKFVTEMFKAGASGYLQKDCKFDELLHAIRTVATGNTYLSPSVTDVVIQDYVFSTGTDGPTAYSALTKREREVLQLLAEGKSIKQLANALSISPKTAEAHKLRIMNKLDIDNVAMLTKYAIQEGLTSVEP